MRIVGAIVHRVRVPTLELSRHDVGETIVVRIVADDGTVGHGEGKPRPDLTGESPELMLAHIAEVLWPAVAGVPLPAAHGQGDLARIGELLPPATTFAASRCAVELAVIDCALRSQGVSLGTVLAPRRLTLAYGGVIAFGSASRVARDARRARLAGFQSVRLELGGGGLDEDVACVRIVRDILGPSVHLCIDAGGAWSLDRAILTLQAVSGLDIAQVEQPLRPGRVSELAELRRRTRTLVIADESVVSPGDAARLIDADACDGFDLKLSKCGGLASTLAIAELAASCGLAVQIGCEHGETGILAAAGRHVASSLPELAGVEGSFGTHQLCRDLATPSVTFGHAGVAPLLRGPGLGVVVDDRALAMCSPSIVELSIRDARVSA